MKWSIGAAAMAGLVSAGAVAQAEAFRLEPIIVTGENIHPSQQIREEVDEAYNSSRSASGGDGAEIQNLNPVNTGDAIRFTAPGLINQPGAGDRFGGGTKIRTFGDFGAAQSIDGLPAYRAAGVEGGGYSNTTIPSIAIDSMSVLKGGRAVQYGDGTDGGVLVTTIKSGRNYTDHRAITVDASSAREGQFQAEAADHSETWDYYVAGRGFLANYESGVPNPESQTIFGGLGKAGLNLSDDTRLEFLAIYDKIAPDVYRNGDVQDTSNEEKIGSATLSHRYNERHALEVGLFGADSQALWPARGRDRGIRTIIAFADHNVSAPLSESVHFAGSFGGEYKYTRYTRDGIWDNRFDDYALKAKAAFTFEDNLTLTGGLRQTWFNNEIVVNDVEQPDNLQDSSVLSYQLGASYSVLENTRLRASYASGFNRFYSKYGNFGEDALNTEFGAGDDIVESQTIEVGLRQSWSSGYFDAAAYTIHQDKVPRRSTVDPGTGPVNIIESVEVDQSGLEFEFFQKVASNFTLAGGYMWVFDVQATRADGTDAGTNIFFGSNGASVPEHQFMLRADYWATEDLGVWGAGYVTTGYEGVNADDSVTSRDGYVRLDLGATYLISDDWAVRARVENLLDERDFGTTPDGVAQNDAGKLGRVFWIGTDVTF